ncbi:MAG: hypothetical protein A2622_04160 [Bdellovibrionales bacterium RIFCSPHIGHO2_01_FULL_40_29]|nr:MAG: hypothetical protein A2622_04160 [Bdellovibrionales bacterium RIFCSPHIGHO2_01_FULL_40_29]OFZ34868.1 MAG: hypothetical protein A3D17_11215 [Bdellovibrionales bacterium RIFCSPHIGHO2_02_FULL_40_15]
MSVIPKVFTEEDRETWRAILHAQKQTRDQQVCDLFLEGVEILGLREDHFPVLEETNQILRRLTNFEGVLVEGLEEGAQFYNLLKHRQFPVGNFIRNRQDLSYTPAPDIVHDLYGHLPFFTDKTYADFCQEFGAIAMSFADRPELLNQFERFFWFTIEFGLIQTPQGRRIFGAGIASSIGECQFALSDQVEVVPFSVAAVCDQDFRIDQIQKKLFCLTSPQQLYDSLDELRRRVQNL